MARETYIYIYTFRYVYIYICQYCTLGNCYSCLMPGASMICTSPAGDLRTGDEPAGPSNCFGALCDLDGLEVDDGWPWPRSRVWSHVRWSYLKDLEGISWTYFFLVMLVDRGSFPSREFADSRVEKTIQSHLKWCFLLRHYHGAIPKIEFRSVKLCAALWVPFVWRYLGYIHILSYSSSQLLW